MNALISDFVAKARHKITVAESRAMQAAGVFGDADYELIDGELIDKGSDGGRSINYTAAIARWLFAALAHRDDLVIVPDKTVELSDHNGPKPDFWVFPDAFSDPQDVRGPDLVLAIEISDTTLSKDLGPKAALYAAHGVRDYWVIDCANRRVIAHRLKGDSYDIETYAADEPCAAALIASLTLRLADLRRV